MWGATAELPSENAGRLAVVLWSTNPEQCRLGPKVTQNSGLKYNNLIELCVLNSNSSKPPNSFVFAAVLRLPVRGWLRLFFMVPLAHGGR